MSSEDPIFKAVFGSNWDTLPLTFQKRYMNRPYSQDIITVQGKMDIYLSKGMACLIPVLRLFCLLVPYKGKDIPVKVDFRSTFDSATVYLDRKFYFPGKKPYEFNSHMQVIAENEVMEHMSFGICWRSHYFYDGKKVIMQHRRYVWKIFSLNIPLPLEVFFGIGYAEEEVIDDNTYRTTMTITHFLFGTMYRYSGNFIFTRLPA